MKYLKGIASFFLGIIYYTIALILAVGITIGLVGGTGYYFYKDLYLKYIDVQLAWVEYDNAAIHEMQVYSKSLQEIKNTLDTHQWNDESKKINAHNEYAMANSMLQKVRDAMSYKDKHATYKYLNDIRSKIVFLGNELKLQEVVDNVKNIEQKRLKAKEQYNGLAFEWNENSKKFPNSYIIELVNFHDWELIQ